MHFYSFICFICYGILRTVVQSFYLANILGVWYHIKRLVSAMPTGGEFWIKKKDISNSSLLWFGIHYIHNLKSEIESQLFAVPMIVEAFWKQWLMTACFPINTLHIVYSVVRLFVYSVVRLFGCSFMRSKFFVYSCSFIRSFVFVYSVVRVSCLLRSGFDCK